MEPHAERSVTVTYDCPACHASSTAVVAGVTDPSTLMSGAEVSCGALMIAEAIRFAIARSGNDAHWRAAAEKIRFAGPYR